MKSLTLGSKEGPFIYRTFADFIFIEIHKLKLNWNSWTWTCFESQADLKKNEIYWHYSMNSVFFLYKNKIK